MSYLPCELHCHSIHSDGSFSVAELLRRAYDDHLALIALTDHNTVSGHGELDDSITPAVPGIEWTTFFGHMLVLGARDFVDWRDAVPANIDDKIDQVHAAGGLCGVAHPFQLGSPICTGGRWAFDVQDWNRVDYLEVWHDAFGPDNGENVPATELWKSLLDKAYHLPITYGRDWHRQSDRHFGVTYLNMEEPTAACALEAIRAGRVTADGAVLTRPEEKVDEGALIAVDGEALRGPSPKVGFMPQQDQLFPWRSIWDNVTLALAVRGENTPENQARVRSLLERYGLWAFRDKRPGQLSGGMRQRCALIRTLAADPRILLLDEPFSALDYQTRLSVSADIYRIIRQEGKTALLVTHDISEAISMSDRVAVLPRRPAGIKAVHDMGPLRGLPPMERRDTPEFHTFFNAIWKELELHD